MSTATPKQIQKLAILLGLHLIDRDAFKKYMGVLSTKDLTIHQVSRLIDHYENLPMVPIVTHPIHTDSENELDN